MTNFYAIAESQKQEYIELLKLWIIKQNAVYVKDVEFWRKRGRSPKHFRHPNIQPDVVHDIEWHWREALWCQDIATTTCPEEFFQDAYEWGDSDDEEVQQLLNACFDEAFRAVMPKNLHCVLEG